MSKPRVVLFDMDGTLATMKNRGPYDWAKVGQDDPNEAVVELAHTIIKAGDLQIVIVSGRDEVCKDETVDWLTRHQVFFADIFMRPYKDNRKDSVVKKELYELAIAPRYDVAFVVDDRRQVVEMWRDELGLTVFQCAPGDF